MDICKIKVSANGIKPLSFRNLLFQNKNHTLHVKQEQLSYKQRNTPL